MFVVARPFNRGIFGFVVSCASSFSSCVCFFSDTPAFEGAPFIQDVDDDSVLFGKMLVGDRLIALDGEDVSDLTAQQVSKIISRKSHQQCRKFRILRKNEKTSPRSSRHSTWDMPAHDEQSSAFGGLV
jgi:PDZ domain-containing secreted protein